MTYSDPFGPPHSSHIDPHPIDPFRVRGDGGVGSSDDYSTKRTHRRQFESLLNGSKFDSVLNGLKYTAIASGLIAGYTTVSIAVNDFFSNRDEVIPQNVIQQDVIGNNQPERYILKDGIKYYSHLDGKDISDLLKK